MKKLMMNFWSDEEGMGTLEILLIIAVLVGVAILFGNTIIDWVKELIEGIDITPPSAE